VNGAKPPILLYVFMVVTETTLPLPSRHADATKLSFITTTT